MIVLLAAAAMTAAPDLPRPSNEECQVLRAAVGAELSSEKHLAETLRLTAIPNEWLLDGRASAPDSAGHPLKVNPAPGKNMLPASLSACRLREVFSSAWKVRRSGARNLAFASRESLLSSKADAYRQGMDSVMVSRATIDELNGRATVIFGGYCGSVDVLEVAKGSSGEWISSQPQPVWFTLCDVFVTDARRK